MKTNNEVLPLHVKMGMLVATMLALAALLWSQGVRAEEAAAPVQADESVITETVTETGEGEAETIVEETTTSGFNFAETETAEESGEAIVETEVPLPPPEPEIPAEETAGAADASSTVEAIVETLSATPELSTDKSDYHPGETATIFGRFFAPLQSFMVKVFGSDEQNQNYTETETEVTTDETGSFSLTYLLDMLYRPFYEVVVATLEGEKVAETWFRDAAVAAYNQCSNNTGTGYTNGDLGCRFINGAINGNNSRYQEGDATLQRLVLDGFAPGSSHTVTLQYGTTKQGKHAYDFLTSWDHSENWATLTDRCDGLAGCTTAAESTFPIPNDTNGSGQFQGTVGPRNFVMRGGTITAASAPVLSGSYTGDSETSITISFTVPNSGPLCSTKSQVTSCGVILWFGAHIAKSSDWVGFDGTTGAGSISGAPYHVAVTQLDGGSIGNRDNQMQASAIPSTIIIRKDTVPNAAQDFAFTTTGTGLSNFTLDDDGENTVLSNTRIVTGLNAGNYSVTETAVPGYAVTISCIDATGNTVVNNANRVANIALADGETVECTFTNTLQTGSITVVKNTVGGNGAFDFTANIAGNFALNTVNNTANQVFSNVLAGTYSIAETVPNGWAQTSATCSDGSPVNAINLSAGENITCTFVNSKLPTLTINKVVTNDNGGTAVANDFQGTVDGNNVAWGATQTYSVGAHTASETTLPTYTASAWSGDCAADGSVTLAYGDNKVCSITNDDKAATLIVEKVVINDNGGTAEADDFGFKVNNGTTVSFESNAQNVMSVKAGTYSVTEPAAPGYTTSYSNCTDLVIPNGGTATCVITNDDQAPSLTLIKEVVNDNGGTAVPADFTLTATGPSGFSGAGPSVSNGASFDAGEYNLGESGPAGYAASDWSCVGGTQDGASVTLDLGQSATCTIVNNDIAPKLHLRKVVVNDNGGSAAVTDWTLTADGAGNNDVSGTTPVDSGAGLVAGTFALSESAGPAGYAASDWSCVGGTQNGASITLGINEEATCTITNDDQQAYIIVDKTVVNDNGGTAAPNDFLLTVDGNAVSDGVAYPVNPGAHKAGETLLGGYTASDWGTDCDADGDVTVALGQTKTCTITNNDNAPKLTLNKILVNDNGGTATEANWTLTATGPTNVSGPGAVGDADVVSDASFDAGEYVLSESAGPAGYAASGWTCSNGDTDGTITVALGDDITCSITNNDIAPSLTLVKQVVNDDGGAAEANDWTLTATGPTSIEGAGGASSDAAFDAGQYALSESTGPAGYTAGAWSCVGGTQNGASITLGLGQSATCTIINDDQPGTLKVTKVTDPVSDVTTEFDITASVAGSGEVQGVATKTIVGGQTVAYTVDAGTYDVSEADEAGWVETENTCNDVVVPNGGEGSCTITNVKLATIIIEKDAINNSAQDFTFTNNFGEPHPASFLLDDDSNATLPKTRSFQVMPGTYAVSEAAVAGRQQESATCTDQSPVGAISVTAGETVTCTFVNEQYAKIILVKNTQGGDGDFDFDATGDGLSADIDLTTDNGTASVTFSDLDQDNTYSITENVPEGWTLISSSCTGEGNTPASITPDPGETVTCTFVNGKLPTLTLEKTVVNNYGGEAVEADFQGKINTVNQAWDVPKTLTPGTYTASESSLFGYQASAWGTDCSEEGSVTLAYGDNKVCSITNSDIAPKLTVIKTVINDDGGDNEAGDFTMNVTGTEVSDDSFAGSETGVTVTLDAGTYSVDETVFPGYAKSLGANCAGTIAVGEEKTCTITNDDQPAKITLTKVVTNNNGGNAAPNDFGLTIGGAPAVSGQTYEVDANTEYALNEAGLAGYAFVSLTGDAKCPDVLGGTVELGEGEEVSCTITNDDIPAHLIVIKTVDNGNTGATAEPKDFTTTISGVTTATPSAPGAAAPGIDNVLTSVGAYSVDEGAHVGYDKQLSADCSGTIALGETKTCTITNTAIAPKLTVIKVVDNGNTGATYTAADFQMEVDGEDVPQNIAQTETVGVHTVTETGPAGYSAVYSGDCNEEGEVTLALADEKTCTITNTAIAPKLTLVKTVINDNGGTKGVSDFPLSIDATTVVSGVANTVTVGAHTAAEVNDAAYTASAWGGDCAANGTVSLALAEEKTCTITNDDKPGKLQIIKNTIGGNDTFDFTVDGASDSTPSITTVANTGTTGLFEVNAGTYSVTEAAKAGWDLTSSSCSNGTPANFQVANGETVTCTFTNTKRATVTIVKDAQPNDTQDFAFTSAKFGPFTLDDDATVVDPAPGEELGEWSNTKTFTNVVPGSITVSETQPNQYWKLKRAACVVTGTSNVVTSSLVGTALTFNAAPGADITCTFVNEKISPTRTQGFWQTHTAYTTSKFTSLFAAGMTIGNGVRKTIVSKEQLFGAWYSSIPKLTNGKQRTALDKARMTLLQQLVTAKLNCAAFGCTAGVQTMIANADTAYSGTSASAIMTSSALVDAYNNSGDTVTIGNAGKATPKDSQNLANKAFWDTP